LKKLCRYWSGSLLISHGFQRLGLWSPRACLVLSGCELGQQVQS
jgi:hypothetical protein